MAVSILGSTNDAIPLSDMCLRVEPFNLLVGPRYGLGLGWG